MDIKELRSRIDSIDEELIALFLRRMAVSAQIGAYKKERDLPIFVPEREQEKLADVAAKAGPEMAAYVKRLYDTIFTLSRDYQNEVLE
jgi:chorismate mutase